jgi:hypothetical protein
MERTARVTFEGYDSELNETSVRPIPKQRYQRKVRVTLTRAEAELLRRLLLRVSTDKLAAQPYCQYGLGVKTIMNRFKNVWRKLDRQIDKRDDKQRAKESVDQDPAPVINSDRDVPLF